MSFSSSIRKLKIKIARRHFNLTVGKIGAVMFASRTTAAEDQTIPSQANSYPAESSCKFSALSDFPNPVGLQESQLSYWIDGHWGAAQANIAFHLDLSKDQTKILSRVAFTNARNIVMGERFFTDPYTQSDHFSQYCIFNRVDLRFDDHYFLVVELRDSDSGETSIYRYTLDREKIIRGKINLLRLPTEMSYDFSLTHQGSFYSSRHFPLKMLVKQKQASSGAMVEGYDEYFPYTTIIRMDAYNYFEINVKVRRKNISENDFTRYIIITDPAFRMLSIKKVDHSFAISEHGANMFPLDPFYWKKRWGLSSHEIPKISQCPYLLVFVENPKIGLFVEHIWLR